MILFVGDQPSSRTDPNVPFKGAACEKRLVEWINALGLGSFDPSYPTYKIVNQSSDKFKDAVIEAITFNYVIIALGNKASNALWNTKRYVPHFKLPHPSGRNRQINDKLFIENKLSECHKYIQEKLCLK